MVGRDACAMVKGELSKIRASGSVNEFQGDLIVHWNLYTTCSMTFIYIYMFVTMFVLNYVFFCLLILLGHYCT